MDQGNIAAEELLTAGTAAHAGRKKFSTRQLKICPDQIFQYIYLLAFFFFAYFTMLMQCGFFRKEKW